MTLMAISPCVNCYICCRGCGNKAPCLYNWFVFWWFVGGLVCGLSCAILNALNVVNYKLAPQIVFTWELLLTFYELMYHCFCLKAASETSKLASGTAKAALRAIPTGTPVGRPTRVQMNPVGGNHHGYHVLPPPRSANAVREWGV
jgi:hypothetical protein